MTKEKKEEVFVYSEQQEREKPCDKSKASSSDGPRQAGRFVPSAQTVRAIRLSGFRQDGICAHRRLEIMQQSLWFQIHIVGYYFPIIYIL